MSQLKEVVKNLPVLGKWVRKFNTYRTRVPAGHYYSPIVSVKDIKRREQQVYPLPCNKLEGLDLAEEEQIALITYCFNSYYQELAFSDNINSGGRYYYNNKYFGHADATSLYFMIRHFNPKKIIEVGSGFSSAVMLDVNERFFDNAMKLSFIEPYPDRLHSLLKHSERKNTDVIVSDLQDVDTKYFEQLEKDDILFIDSTHVSKTGSDVNYLLFNIFPILKSGVIIHIHDIFYPFEYPKEWVIYGNGRFGWNEAYILRAFLSHQSQYKIILFNDFMQSFHKQGILLNMLNYNQHGRGGSIYLRKY
ncbi:class I SAM-dependent methyltransferase [Dyadobacter chenhuakuii]|uniref:Class I SAM-dependent methyltransferase n=1 Tax=Dyadobacter chenhuakuii TaxID=2909339 RepID=A0ABY4XN78_9BACT|nr:class I SAM-dependent methyltransferase [Dyadobacter chenhuakuii]MCF2494775.1 class I SAM-dependent methyltransferase [Dyadobacter chenhuakuii]USJ31904.1 class I SAM-dependent methyltransferase [Dyadobacter chenhuakuii]